MAPTFRERNLMRRFDRLDTNADGFLEWDDFEAHARRLSTAFAEPPDSPKALAVLGGYRDFWEGFVLPMDGDGDGRVSRGEFVASVTRGITDRDSFDRVYGPHVRAVAALADTDGDGLLDLHEYIRLMRVYEVGGEDAQRTFVDLDLDHDGTLSVDELITAARRFYLDAEAAHPGSRILGVT